MTPTVRAALRMRGLARSHPGECMGKVVAAPHDRDRHAGGLQS
jgi:hypothetical protein